MFKTNIIKIFKLKNKDHLTENINSYPISNDSEKAFKEMLNKSLKSKAIIQFSKLLVDIIKDDPQSQVKDLSVEILLILKNILKNDDDFSNLEKYENLISALPDFRANMIISGRTKSFIENNSKTEKEYKENLNKIKSNLQNISNNKSQRKSNRVDTIQSCSKEKNMKNGLRNNLNKIKSKANDTSVSHFDNHEMNENLEENNEIKESEKNSLIKNFKKINSKLNSKKNNNGVMNTTSNYQNEDSKYKEISISDEESDLKTEKILKNLQHQKSPNIKLIKKKLIKENSDNNAKDKTFQKKKAENEQSNSNDKSRKIKQNDRDEKVKKELRGKFTN